MRILIELPSWLGDTVMATPAIENLIEFHQPCELILVGTKVSIEVLKNHPKVSKTYILDKNYLSMILMSKELKKFDKFLSFRKSFRSNVFKFLVSSKNKFQFNKNNYKNLHQVEKYSKFMNDALKTEKPIGPLIIHSIKLKSNKANSKVTGKPMLGINPGASYGNAKRWYPEEFSEVIVELSNQYDTTILGGPNEIEIAKDIQKIIEKRGVTNYQNLAGTLNIAELIDHISNFNLFITGDSGPMHIAAHYKIPTVSIFGPTKHRETSQWHNEKSFIVKTNLPCQPCMKRKCPLKHHNCMKLIKAKDALLGVNTLNL